MERPDTLPKPKEERSSGLKILTLEEIELLRKDLNETNKRFAELWEKDNPYSDAEQAETK